MDVEGTESGASGGGALPRGLRPGTLERARALRKVRDEQYEDVLPYVRFVDDWQGLTRGTLVVGGATVPGYPGIPRILRLDSGIREQFDGGAFFVEDKVDGYNVRVFREGDRVLAATRGGLVCPFTTDRLPDLLDCSVLADDPDLVLCGEVAGPDNPYMEGTPPDIDRDVRFFLFDIGRRGERGFLPHREKMRLVERYGLPAARVYGRFDRDEHAPVRDLLARLNEEGREGVVLKEDGPRDRRAKYVTSNSSVYDIGVGSESLLQLAPEYFTGRILRLALFLDEVGLSPDDDLRRRLGDALLAGVVDKVRQYQAEGRVYHTYRCRFRQEPNARRFLRHMERVLGHVHVTGHRLTREGEYWLLEFDKELPRMTSLLQHIFGGGSVFD